MLTLDQQAQRAYRQLQAQPNDLAKNVYLDAIEQYSHEYRLAAGDLPIDRSTGRTTSAPPSPPWG